MRHSIVNSCVKAFLVGISFGLGTITSVAIAVTVSATFESGDILTASNMNIIKTAVESIPHWEKSSVDAYFKSNTDDDNTGKVGIGTDTPIARLDVRNTGTEDILNLYDDTSEVMTVLDGGNVGIGITNPTTKLDISGTVNATAFVGDGSGLTGISTNLWSQSSGNIYYNSGNVGIGIASPSNALHIDTDYGIAFKISQQGNINFTFENNGSSGIFEIIDNSSKIHFEPGMDSYLEDGNLAINATSAGTYELFISGDMYTSAGCDGCSDVRWKSNIKPIEKALDKVNKLVGVTFYWKSKEYPDRFFHTGREIGLIAQDVEKIIPELVYQDEGYKFLRYEKLTAILVEAVKELKNENDELRTKIKSLE